ncbi:MAG: ABC-type transport auxiliary lipoprotein family protein [Caulobacteraceae bacterium]
MRRRSLLAAAPAVLLAGCVSLLPKEPPAQLYRFGGDLPPATRAPGALASSFAVQVLPISFVRASAGDMILTTTGNEAAYIKGERWVSGAQGLFEHALANAFDADQGPARLMAPGEAVPPDYFLKIDVRTFEARYLQGQGAPPTIVVEVYAALSIPAERRLAGEHIFSASVPAGANRVGAIATAFDQATDQVLEGMVKWVDARGQPGQAGASSARPG